MSTDKALANRYDFVLIFDVKDGNPNGDPDAGNMPRLDAESGHGLVTDVSLKRKVRNFIGLVKGEQTGFDIFIKEKAVLNQLIERAYEKSPEVQSAMEAWKAWQKDKKKNQKPPRHYEDIARDWMCHNFFDVRTFGAVMSTGDEDAESKLKKTAGQVRGPVQLTFARSVEPIVALEHSITRMAVTNEKDLEKERTMGRKHTVPYGVYVAHGFVSSFLAKQTGFGEDDLELVFQALAQMFEHDRSAARGEMSTRGLYVFKHDSELGNAPAHALFDRLKVEPKSEGEVARSFDAYAVAFDGQSLAVGQSVQPAPGVTLTRRC
ncbi:type I-C CRISPR-associated protein Cas7/Csd2 [Rhodoferax sp. U2-2l]|uniref:type I-C CRISPR-associated protein Cas7/Csd2 n=1 Tax=Rhodoferax sp. U2-2l TaxID=2884000 RepID=UPI001D0AB7C4|nr:type I-C CRISPR-associated protein Cas7/Csd2 [Rhodoferax sp. U2-2l]MCB8747384.1 type I-C CRISPR-associated protein Cas7/Csd2 [Rhodoferax sp. U2-2l]